MGASCEDFVSELVVVHFLSISRILWKSLEVSEIGDFFIGFFFDSCSFRIYWIFFQDFCDKKSSRSIDVWPPLLLEDDLKSLRILLLHCLQDSFIFDEVQSTG